MADDNTSDKQLETDDKYPNRWKPGQSGNLNGRPKGLSITEMVREALEEVEPQSGQKWKDLVIKRILVKAVSEGDANIIKAMWNYIDGMPLQKTDLTTLGEKLEAPHITIDTKEK